VLRAALEIDPLYVHPRCNLAHYLLDEDDVEGAQEMLKPLGDVTRFHPRDMATYSFTQARILVAQEQYDAAREALEAALELWPGYEPAQDLLDRLDGVALLSERFEAFLEERRDRRRAYRQRLQGKLTTLDPALSKALPLHTKDALTGTARAVIRWGGWSTLKKADLADRIASYLLDPDDLEWVIGRLSDEARQALAWLLDEGGYAPWEDFDEAYDNDLEESRYWNYHTPETVMGSLRLRGLLFEATVDGEVWVTIPVDLRPLLEELLD
jgi:tetratricopeptide (TPR) repeat protein